MCGPSWDAAAPLKGSPCTDCASGGVCHMIRISTLAICIALFWNLASAQAPDAGRRTYQARCVGCHGEDGTGGGHGATIVDVRRPRATSKDAVRDLILKGIHDG